MTAATAPAATAPVAAALVGVADQAGQVAPALVLAVTERPDPVRAAALAPRGTPARAWRPW